MDCLSRWTNRLQTLINERTLKQALPFTSGDENQPELQLSPELFEINTTSEESESFCEKSFNERRRNAGENIETKVLFGRGKDKDKAIRSVAIIGGAGSGKTVFLKKFVNEVFCGRVSALNDVTVVHYTNLKKGELESKATLAEILFKDCLNKRDSMRVLKWIRKNPKKLLLLLDNVDHCRESLNSTDIVNSILSGDCLKGVRVLYSSRRKIIQSFKVEFLPDRLVAMAGFSLNSIDKLIHHIGRVHGDELWSHLQTNAQCLLSYCSVPLFAHFTVRAFLRRRSTPPQTLTEVLLVVLCDIVTSGSVASKKESFDLLGKIAFEAMKQERASSTIIETDYLVSSASVLKSITQMKFPLSSGGDTDVEIFYGSPPFSFCHPIVKEMFSSLYLCQLPITEFKDFVNRLHIPYWAGVRRLVCGLLLNRTTQKIWSKRDPSAITITEIAEKGRILKESLAEEFEKSREDQENLLELLHAANECGNDAADLVASAIKNLTLQNVILTRADGHLLASIATRCDEFTNLALEDADTSQVSILGECLMNSGLKVKIEKIGDGKENQLQLRKLLHVSVEPGNPFGAMVKLAVREIILGEVGLDMSDIGYLATLVGECKRLVQLTVRSCTTLQLRRLAKSVGSRKIKLQIKNPAILDLPSGEERFKLLCALHECGDAIDDFVGSYLSRVDIVDVDAGDFDVRIVISIVARCSRLEWFRIPPCFCLAELYHLVETVKKSNLQVERMYFTYWGSYPDLTDLEYYPNVWEVPSLSLEGAKAVCSLLPHAEKEFAIQFKLEDESVEMIKKAFDLLPPKELKVWIFSPGPREFVCTRIHTCL